MVRPATTARMVANATAATMPSSSVPPSLKASSGTAESALPGADRIWFAPTSHIAPNPSTSVHR